MGLRIHFMRNPTQEKILEHSMQKTLDIQKQVWYCVALQGGDYRGKTKTIGRRNDSPKEKRAMGRSHRRRP